MPGKHTNPRAMATGQAKEEKKGRELSESKQKRKANRKENRDSRAADRQANRDSRRADRQANRKKRLETRREMVANRQKSNVDKVETRRKAGQTARMETRQSRIAAQSERLKRLDKRIKKNTPEEKKQEAVPANYGPFKMKPGSNSKVNAGNFKGSEVQKYSAFMYNPTLTDLSGDDKVTKKDHLIKVGAKGFEKGMDNKAQMHHGPGMFNIGGVMGMTKAGQLANQGFKKRKKLGNIGGMFNIGRGPFKYDK